MRVRVGKAAAVGVQPGVVGCECVALLVAVGIHRRVGFLKGYRLDFQVVQVGKVLQIQLSGCALRNADRRALEFLRARKPQVFVN